MQNDLRHDRALRRAAHAARQANQRLRLFGPDGRPLLASRGSEAHFHIMYNDIVHWTTVFETPMLAFKEVHRLGLESEPNTAWYDEGPVMIETALPGRTGKHRVILQVVECHISSCLKKAKDIYRVPIQEETSP